MVKMKWLGWINFYFMMCALAIITFMIINRATIGNNKTPVVERILPAIPLPDIPTQPGISKEGLDLQTLMVATPDLIAAGRSKFQALCATCHGAEGKGDGVAGVALNPLPRNFTSLEGWTNGPQFEKVFISITEGITGTGMAPYGTLEALERIQLAHYVQSLAEAHPKPTPEGMAELDQKYALSVTQKAPNKISIDIAIQKIAKEVAQ
jgi:mono/diheme cytochrome c family protein